MDVKMKFRMIEKNTAADPEIGFLTKLIIKAVWRPEAMPTATELIYTSKFDSVTKNYDKIF